MNMLADKWYIGGLQVTPHDRQFRAANHLKAQDKVVPVRFDNRQLSASIRNQGDKPHCAAHALVAVLQSHDWSELHEIREYPTVPLYDKAKDIDGDYTDGTSFTSVCQAAIEIGYMPTATGLYGLSTVHDVMCAVHEMGLALIGLDVTDAWGKVTSDGWIQDNGGTALGGHAVVACAWDSEGTDWIGFKNSWGNDFGAAGFGRMRIAQFEKRFLGGMAVELPQVTGKGW